MDNFKRHFRVHRLSNPPPNYNSQSTTLTKSSSLPHIKLNKAEHRIITRVSKNVLKMYEESLGIKKGSKSPK